MDRCHLDTFLNAILHLELDLPTEDVRSNPFFHGQASRQASEQLLSHNGHFLVRESGTSPGQYVLSCLHNETHLHFLIHRHLESTDKEEKFSFEGSLFNSVRELINFYLTHQQPITEVSQAVISKSVNRSVPLEVAKLTQYYESRPNSSLTTLLEGVNLSSHRDVNIESEITFIEDACFSSDYLRHLKAGISAIKLEQASNLQRSGEARLCSTVCETIAQTGPRILASHLFKRNLAFIGLDFDENSRQNCTDPGLLRSGIELMCLPEGKQIRRDTIIRHECLKYFVVMTILKSGDDLATRCSNLRKWIQTADQTVSSFGDYFAFGAIMAGLCHAKITALKNLWQNLKIAHPKEAFLYESSLRPHFINLLKAEESLSLKTTFPFVIQLCHLIECNYIVNSKLLPLFSHIQLPDVIEIEAENHDKIGLGDFTLDNILKHIELSINIVDKLSLFERNAQSVSKSIFFQENSLEEIFKTSFHLRFLFNREIDIIQLNHEIFRNLENQLIDD